MSEYFLIIGKKATDQDRELIKEYGDRMKMLNLAPFSRIPLSIIAMEDSDADELRSKLSEECALNKLEKGE